MSLKRHTDSEDTIKARDTTNRQSCDECGGNIIYSSETAEEVCEECGIVVNDTNIDYGPEWRSNTNETGESRRAGNIITEQLYDRGISATISDSNYDARGNLISAENRRKMTRLRKKDKWKGNDSKARKMNYGLGEINRMGTSLGIPSSVIDIASVIYRKIHSKGLLVGRSIEAAASAALYIGCKIEHITRTFEEIESTSRVDVDRVRRMYLYTLKKMDIEVPPTSPEEFIPRFISRTNATTQHEAKAISLLEIYKRKSNISGKAPSVLAATAIYAAGIKINRIIPQNVIAEEANIAQCSIRENYRELLRTDPEITIDISSNNKYSTHPAGLASKINDTEVAKYQ
jgi:transcription initiation factor TFIIB